ncbi:MAG: hypothetical protein JW715_08375 [Sedimentisphaerales bacterium]|nr:hypothetical protein [Sedimentisphaerales bacterium]
MKRIIFTTILTIHILLPAGCGTMISSEYQNMPVTSDPNEGILENRAEKEENSEFIKTPVSDDQLKEKLSASKSLLVQDESFAIEAGLHRHAWEMGSEMYYFRYLEPHIMEDNGVFYGTMLGYTYRSWVPVSPGQSFSEGKGLLRLEGRFASGQVDYEGSLSDGTPYNIDNIDDFAVETRLLFGVEELDEDWLASLYTGIGYRYLYDDTSFDQYGYERESNYLYIPFGYQLDGSFPNRWSWGCRLETDFLIQGTQKSHLSDIGYLDIENHQRSGYGLRASLRLRNYSDRGIFVFEPFIRYWNIDESDPSYTGYGLYGVEPENRTTEYGVQFVWMF